MEAAEFEEKDFEASLYHQLAAGSPNLWTPGQVFEHHFGIDAALYTEHKYFMSALGRATFHRPLILDHMGWGYVWRSYGRKRRLPTFRTNALIQAKRPDFLKGRNPTLADLGMKGEYWRFHVTKHQQELLERLFHKVKGRAIVSYASPAFHLWSDLDRHISSTSLVNNFSYVSADRLKGHHQWCYNQPGGTGIACSTPHFIEGPSFLRQIDRIMQNDNKEDNPENANEYLTLFSKQIEETAKEEHENFNPLASAIIRRYETLSQVNNLRAESIAFLKILTFVGITKCLWFTVGSSAD